MAQSTQELRRDIEDTRAHLGSTLDTIGDRVSPGRIVQRRKERIRERMHSVRSAVMGTAESVGSGISSGAHTVAEQTSSAAGAVAHEVREIPHQAIDTTRGNPLAAGLVVFGIGLVAASAMPATDPERRAAALAKEKLEPVKEQAKAVGQELASEVKDTAREAASDVKQEAQAAAAEVKDEAKSAASGLKDEAQTAAQELRDEATPSTSPGTNPSV